MRVKAEVKVELNVGGTMDRQVNVNVEEEVQVKVHVYEKTRVYANVQMDKSITDMNV